MSVASTCSSGRSIREILDEKLQSEIITRSSPTTDHEYKRVFLQTCTANTAGAQSENIIGRSFADSILKLTMPNIDLTTRKVEVRSEYVNEPFKNFYLATKNFLEVPEPQNLRVDALYCADIDDARRSSKTLQTRSGDIFLKPAYILGEMQVGKQDFGVRLLSYITGIFSSGIVSLGRDQIPPSVYGAALCMWGGDKDEDNFVKNVGRLNSSGDDVEFKSEQNFTELSGCLVFLGKHEEITAEDTRNSLDKKLQNQREKLKRKVVKYFTGKNLSNGEEVEKLFDELKLAEKKVYLWLEFITCAHLMQDSDVENSLSCLKKEEERKPFREAYNAVKLNFGDKNMDDATIEKQYPYAFYFGKLVKEVEKSETTAINNLVKAAQFFVALKASDEQLKQWAEETFLDEKNIKIGGRFIKRLKDREALAGKDLNQKDHVIKIIEEVYNGKYPKQQTSKQASEEKAPKSSL